MYTNFFGYFHTTMVPLILNTTVLNIFVTADVGKTSLILSLVSEEFPEEVS